MAIARHEDPVAVEVRLLEEPERRANGYKQYGVSHLVRLLRIKRLVDLGFSLSQIAAMGDDGRGRGGVPAGQDPWHQRR